MSATPAAPPPPPVRRTAAPKRDGPKPMCYDLEATLAEYKARANPNLRIVGYDTPFTDKPGCYKKYSIVDMNVFMKSYCAWPQRIQRRWHEAILRDAPCKLFADIEFEDDLLPGAEGKLTKILAEITKALGERVGLKEVPEPFITEATTPVKFSVHITYPTIWFATPQHLHELVKNITGIDTGPYTSATNETCQFMRMPYSEKYQKRNPLVLRPRPGFPSNTNTQVLSPEIICSCLATWYAPDQESSPDFYEFMPRPTQIYRLAGAMEASRRSQYADEISLEEGDEVRGRAQRVLEHMKLTHGQFTTGSIKVKQDGSWECFINPPLPCPTKGRMHRSHQMYLGSIDSRRVFFRCPDPECRTTTFLPDDFTAIAYSEQDFD